MWRAADQSVWFVDIKQGCIHRLNPQSGATSTWAAPEAPSFVLPLEGEGLLVGARAGLHRFDPVSGQFDLVLAVEGDRQDNRLNDACVDAQGDLWFGTTHDPELV